jgi:hypothetical protein
VLWASSSFIRNCEHDSFIPVRILPVFRLLLSYGTVLYYSSFFFNGRQRGIPIAEVVGWVGGSNGIWIIFPLIGMYVSFQLISTKTFDVLRN